MLRSEQDIYSYETEEKPNHYSMIALLCCIAIIVVCWLVNEIGIFRVGKDEMRIGAAITFVTAAIPACMLLFSKTARSNPSTKYYIVVAVGIYTFTVGTLLTFHTTIMMLFPVMIAMLYRSKRVGVIAAAFSFFSAAFAPVLGYMLGTWDVEFFKELILISSNGTAVIEGAYEAITLLSIGKILLYIVFPRMLMIGSCTMLMFYVIQIGEKHVENQIELFRVSRRDYLTGLFNQNCYKEALRAVAAERYIGVIFFDVNNLKSLNDTRGHEYGDLLLKRCAKSILAVCDDVNAYGFRLGGDEFLLLLLDADEVALNEKVAAWQTSLAAVNRENETAFEGLECSMAWGVARGSLRQLEELTQLADKAMYANKQRMKGN